MPPFKSRAEFQEWQKQQQQRGQSARQPPPQQQQQQQAPQPPQQPKIVAQRHVPPPAAQVQQPIMQPQQTLSMAAHLHHLAAVSVALTATVVADKLPYFSQPPQNAEDWRKPVGVLESGMRVRVHHPQTKICDAVFMYLQVVNPINAELDTYYVPVIVSDPSIRAAANLPEGSLLTGFHFPGTSVVLPPA